MGGPLEGITVVDASRSMVGWRMTQLFADYGADVIWVEPPGGDRERTEHAIEHAVFNRGKQSIELDVDTESDRRCVAWPAGDGRSLCRDRPPWRG